LGAIIWKYEKYDLKMQFHKMDNSSVKAQIDKKGLKIMPVLTFLVV